VLAAGEELGPDDVLRGEAAAGEGFALAQDGALSVALDTELDDELLREGRARELVHRLNAIRREAGLELTDRIALTLREADADLLAHKEWIARETLALAVAAGGTELAISKS
jgi:isoleucyl-tRNA synthetase